MHRGKSRTRKVTRRGQPLAPKRRKKAAGAHPFRQTASGFEGFIPRSGAEDFFFSQLVKDPDAAAKVLEHGGEDRERIPGDPRVGVGISAAVHVVLVLFLLFEPSLSEMLNLSEPQPERAELEKREALVLFMEEEPPPLVAPVPLVPAPAAPEQPPPEAQAQPPPADDRLLIPKAMIEPEQRAEVMNDLPFSTGNTDEFYTEEEVKDPGTEGSPEEAEPEPEPVIAESGQDDVTSEEVIGADNGTGEPEVADQRIDSRELGDLLFDRPSLRNESEPKSAEARRERQISPPEPRLTPGDLGEGGEDGRFTDIRRFLAGAQFHNPEGGLVTNMGPSMYYNDRGANFVPWIRRMLSEVGRIWRAGMPWAANVYAGHTAVRFKVARDGTVIAYETLIPSGIAGFDNIAVGAIRGADLLPLPNDYPDDTFEIIIVFWYNERPYDIFG